MTKSILITGSAGFIGFHLAQRLLNAGWQVFGMDNFNDYYDTKLKEDRNNILAAYDNFKLYRGDLSDLAFVKDFFDQEQVDLVCNLAAQAGVRDSLKNPYIYVNSNLVGFVNLLEQARLNGIKKIVYASSSSVYGLNNEAPFSLESDVNNPVSLYGATKRANELIAKTYQHLYNIDMIGLRFFTVYGAWGRPDMAYYSFSKAIDAGHALKLFNPDPMWRDFTYIDDIIDGLVAAIDRDLRGYHLFNLGNNQPVRLWDLVKELEKQLGKTANIEVLPMQQGDVLVTHACIDLSIKHLDFSPKTNLSEGLSKFIDWYKSYGNN